MKLPEYVTVEEVRRVCKELKIRDWTKFKKPEVLLEEAKIILSHVNTDKIKTVDQLQISSVLRPLM
jgi:hypothetical protein